MPGKGRAPRRRARRRQRLRGNPYDVGVEGESRRGRKDGYDTNMTGRGGQMGSRLQYLGRHRAVPQDDGGRDHAGVGAARLPLADQGLLPGARRAISAVPTATARELLHARVPRPARAAVPAVAPRRSAAASRASGAARAAATAWSSPTTAPTATATTCATSTGTSTAGSTGCTSSSSSTRRISACTCSSTPRPRWASARPPSSTTRCGWPPRSASWGSSTTSGSGVGILRERVAEGWPPTRGRSQILPMMDFLGRRAGRRAAPASTTGSANYAMRAARARAWWSIISDLLDPGRLRARRARAAGAALRRPRRAPARSRGDEPDARRRPPADRQRDGRGARSHRGRRGAARLSRAPAGSSSSGSRRSAARRRSATTGSSPTRRWRPSWSRSCAGACSDELPLPAGLRRRSRCRCRWCCSTSSRCAGASGACPACCCGRPSLRDREASAFFQRLQRDPLLILQILALLALTLAPGRAGGHRHGRGRAQGRGRARHLGVDEGARRVAHRASTRRAARRCSSCARLRRGRRGHGDRGRRAADASPRRCRATATARWRPSDPRAPRDLPNRLVEAVRTARALVGADPRAEIHVFTDGAFTLARSPEIDRPARALGRRRTPQPERRHHESVGAQGLRRLVRLPGVRLAGELHRRGRRPSTSRWRSTAASSPRSR